MAPIKKLDDAPEKWEKWKKVKKKILPHDRPGGLMIQSMDGAELVTLLSTLLLCGLEEGSGLMYLLACNSL
jgi:hypothetical protein